MINGFIITRSSTAPTTTPNNNNNNNKMMIISTTAVLVRQHHHHGRPGHVITAGFQKCGDVSTTITIMKAKSSSTTRRRRREEEEEEEEAENLTEEAAKESLAADAEEEEEEKNRLLLREKATEWNAKAKALREEVNNMRRSSVVTKKTDEHDGNSSATAAVALDGTEASTISSRQSSSSQSYNTYSSPWSLPSRKGGDGGRGEEQQDNGEGGSSSSSLSSCYHEYRLYIDIGREDGTWMDVRWGASGKRIEFTMDVRFITNMLANTTICDKMIKDNQIGVLGTTTKSTDVYVLESSMNARLRQGFDKMKTYGGGYRLDYNGRQCTARFYVRVDGTSSSSSYGDISIPQGELYFSIPAFRVSSCNNDPLLSPISQLSQKDSPITIRQMGWNTGWRRMESRIVGIFRAIPLRDAKMKDGY